MLIKTNHFGAMQRAKVLEDFLVKFIQILGQGNPLLHHLIN